MSFNRITSLVILVWAGLYVYHLLCHTENKD
jgi:hypothetical protein